MSDRLETLGTVDMLTPRLLDELSRLQDESRALQERTAVCAERKRQLLMELRERGWSLRAISNRIGLSVSRIDQLTRTAKATPPA